jgi:outer membrane protein assembly factor BamB
LIYEIPELDVIPQSADYRWPPSLRVTLYNNFLYYRSNYSKDLVSVNAETGETVWNNSLESDNSYRTCPQIYNNKLYITSDEGLHIYNPATGDSIGMDDAFSSTAIFYDYSFFYNNTLVLFQADINIYKSVYVTAIQCE